MGDLVGEAERRRRECPVPKPGGLVGQILGVGRGDGGGVVKPVVVRVERLGDRRIGGLEGDGKG
jgi:hypothetical protein